MGERLRGYPKEINEEPGATVVSVRHGPKDTSRPETLEQPLQLTEEGRAEVRREAEEFFLYIQRTVPNGALISLSSSIIGRAEETRAIFTETIKEMARQNAASGVIIIQRFKKSGKELSVNELKRKTKDARLKYVIVDEVSDEDLGYRYDENDNITPFNEALEFLKEEHLVNMLWAAHSDEVPQLAQRLFKELRSQYDEMSDEEERGLQEAIMHVVRSYKLKEKRSPEELVAHQLEGIERSLSRVTSIHPDRKHLVHLVQHAPGLSYLALALFGQRVSFENYNNLGAGQDYLEGLTFDVDANGDVIIADFRAQRSSIEPIRIRDLINNLYAQAAERKAAWQEFLTDQTPLARAA